MKRIVLSRIQVVSVAMLFAASRTRRTTAVKIDTILEISVSWQVESASGHASSTRDHKSEVT
jgi:hypothetical protein